MIFGGFAPNSQTAEVLSKALGSKTVMSGSISKGKNDPSQSLQMMERPLRIFRHPKTCFGWWRGYFSTADELKSIPKGNFIVMKTGTYPLKSKLKLFFEWGITFDKVYEMPDKGSSDTRKLVFVGGGDACGTKKSYLCQQKSARKKYLRKISTKRESEIRSIETNATLNFDK